MKTKLYRTVSVEERLPKHGGHFLTDIGLVRFMINDKEWVDDKYITCNPNWWLEEIELPSENDINNELDELPWDSDEAFKEGANFIINYIKGGEK